MGTADVSDIPSASAQIRVVDERIVSLNKMHSLTEILHRGIFLDIQSPYLYINSLDI